MATAEEFTIRLVQQISSPAEQATAALKRLEDQATATKTAVAGIGSGPRELPQLRLPATPKVKPPNELADLRKQLAGLKAPSQIEDLKAKIANFGKPAREAGKGVDALRDSARQLAPALRYIDGPAGKVARLVGKLGIAGAAIVAAVAVVAFVVALAVAAYEIAKFALVSADAERHQRLLYDGMARSVKGGAALEASIEGATDKYPIAAAQIEKFALANLRAGGSAKQLDATLAAASQREFGPNWAKEMLTLDRQTKQLHSNVASLFGGTNVDRFLLALRGITGMFSQQTEMGRSLRALFSNLFGGIADSAAEALYSVELFILGGINGALRLTVGFLQIALAIKTAFAPLGDVLPKIDYVNLGLEVMAGTIGFVAGVVGALAVAVGLIVGPWIAAAVAVSYLYDAIVSLGDVFTEASDKAIDAATAGGEGIGRALIDGLVAGTTAAAGAAYDAVSGVARKMIAVAKGVLQVFSPSRVFANIGENVSLGFAGGVDAGAPEATSSVQRMAVSAASAGGGEGGGSSGGGGGGRTFNMYGDVYVNGKSDGGMRSLFEQVARGVFEAEALTVAPT